MKGSSEIIFCGKKWSQESLEKLFFFLTTVDHELVSDILCLCLLSIRTVLSQK